MVDFARKRLAKFAHIKGWHDQKDPAVLAPMPNQVQRNQVAAETAADQGDLFPLFLLGLDHIAQLVQTIFQRKRRLIGPVHGQIKRDDIDALWQEGRP
jgi:hypothetical protein